MTHLKIWPRPFHAIIRGDKTYEVREDPPQDFKRGDVLCLEEWAPDVERYTGAYAIVRVTHVTDHTPPSPLPEGTVVLGIEMTDTGFDGANRGTPS